MKTVYIGTESLTIAGPRMWKILSIAFQEIESPWEFCLKIIV